MAELPLRYLPGHNVTFIATAGVTGGQCVKVSGNMSVAPTTAVGDQGIGQALYDAITGALVGVGMAGPVATFTASSTVAAGDRVGPSAVAGQIATIAAAVTPTAAEVNNGTRGVIGIALEGIAASASGRVLLIQ